MQFTGAYDKNKRDIYEGDIVKWKGQLGDDDSIIRNDEIFGLVEWNNGSCGFFVLQLTEGVWISKYEASIYDNGTEFYSYDGWEFNWKDLEVVGNKYENSDYVKEGKL